MFYNLFSAVLNNVFGWLWYLSPLTIHDNESSIYESSLSVLFSKSKQYHENHPLSWENRAEFQGKELGSRLHIFPGEFHGSTPGSEAATAHRPPRVRFSLPVPVSFLFLHQTPLVLNIAVSFPLARESTPQCRKRASREAATWIPAAMWWICLTGFFRRWDKSKRGHKTERQQAKHGVDTSTGFQCSKNDCVREKKIKGGILRSLGGACWLTARRWIDLCWTHASMMDFYFITTIPGGIWVREGGRRLKSRNPERFCMV